MKQDCVDTSTSWIEGSSAFHSSRITQQPHNQGSPISTRAAVMFNPYTLRFVTQDVERAYEPCVTKQLARIDLSGSVLLFGMSLLGAVDMWRYDVLGCFW